MAKGIRKIVIFEQGADGSLTAVSELRGTEKKRKRSRGLRQPERNARHARSAVRAWLDELDSRHDKSTRKKKDGWLRDGPRNIMKADRKAIKKLRKLRVF